MSNLNFIDPIIYPHKKNNMKKETLNELAKKIHENAKNKGFHEGKKNLGEMLCLVHSEVSEALEADRKNNYFLNSIWDIKQINNTPSDEFFKSDYKSFVKDSFEAELADIIIRVLDICAMLNIDIDSFVKANMRNNTLREIKHGKKY